MCVRSDWRAAREGDPPRPARAAGAPQRHHARRSGPGAARPASRAASSASIASRAAPAAGVYPQETRLLPIVARPPLRRARRRRRDPQHADLEPGRRADDSAEPGHFRHRSRLGRSGRHAPRSLPDDHRPCRSALRACRASCSTACGRRSSRSNCRRATRSSGAASTKIRATPAPPWPSPLPLRAGDHGVHCRLPVQFDSHDAAGLADRAAGDHRRHRRAAAHRAAVRLHGAAGRAELGRRADQELDRRAEQDPHGDRARARRRIRRFSTAA